MRRPFALLIVAAAARIWMQMAALPPYAGLDEVFHVGRLAFVLEEGRNPRIDEPSMPPYLAASIANAPDRMPAFGVVGERWPEIVRERRGAIVVDHEVDPKPYVTPNYQAQHPSLYYNVVAPVARLLSHRTQRTELILWRIVAAMFTLIAVIAAALLARRWFGAIGVAAVALLVSLPTFLTLVVRVSNDAPAVAFVTCAIALSAAAPARLWKWIAEGLLWGVAIATKLYTWPFLIALPIFWRTQRANRARAIVVTILCAVAIALTIADLRARTHNPLGFFGFDPAAATHANTSIDYAGIVKVLVSSFIWTSGQHWNALKPIGMLLFAAPLVATFIFAVFRARASDRRPLLILGAIVFAFAIAQLVDTAGVIRLAKAAGKSMPDAGKEGWYWYSIAPVAAAVMFPLLFTRHRRIAIAVAFWLVAWDVVIHEMALFHDFAGTTSPLHPSALFRWGPLHAPFTAHLQSIAIGPFVAAIALLRMIHLGATAFLLASTKPEE